ncbi:SPOR domain-containing protein [Mucilaginibacter kameinonensis]|uniref:SPOR domain-containing protein n=1 Tax=Mucilaginibacter kameinonensis TaxID=452286 RepID=UPI000EF852AB|nr:SPOR domain-containing protein [Mucilaginibacter kameinonensis]
MDIANYLSELLGRYTEVSVPGLGCFSRLRVNGYYDDAQATLHPPGHKLHFDQQLKDDEILTRYIAEKKKISLASSKYFTEKYINSLKQELALREVPFAELGWFYLQDGKVAFRAQEQGIDPLFFGLPAIKINKVSYIPPPPPPPPLPSAIPLQQTFTPPPVATVPLNNEPEYIADEPEVERSSNIWIIIALVIVALAAALFGVYKYNPALLHLNDRDTTEQPKVETPKATPVVKQDSTQKDSVPATADTTKAISKPVEALNKPIANADTVAKTEYAIFLGSFKTETKSEEAVKDYKRKGIDAHILKGPGTGPRIKIIIGGFASSDEAETARKKLVSQGKITKDTYSKQITDSTK